MLIPATTQHACIRQKENKMKCDQCKIEIEPGEERDHLGQTLCEDCFMIVMSPLKTCDPWSIYSASTLEKHTGKNSALTTVQLVVLKILEEKGPMAPLVLLKQLERNLTLNDLEQEFAALHHMGKVRKQKEGETVLWRVW